MGDSRHTVGKRWWARVRIGADLYGTWVPTGQVDKAEAVWYMKVYPGPRDVREWLLL